MRFYAIGIGATVLACACGTKAMPALNVGGMWAAPSDAQGGMLTIMLATRNTSVTGTGTYTVGAIRTGSLTVSGTYRQPIATLKFSYDNGETVHFVGTVVDGEQLSGQLSYRSGAAVPIKFVRP